MSARTELFSQKNLVASWKLMSAGFRRNTAPGIDGVSRDQFGAAIESEAKFISVAVAANEYSFQPLRAIAIPKSHGRVRIINVPTIRDRFVQRILLRFLFQEYQKKWKLPQSFSSLGGVDDGVLPILKRVASALNSNDYVIKADLSNYFDRIDREALHNVVCGRIAHRSLHGLLKSVIECETSEVSSGDRALLKKGGLKKGRGVRQGMPLSPVFSYLFLMDLDRAMPLGFFRYVDDLVFHGSNVAELKSRFFAYCDEVKERGLEVHSIGQPADKPKTELVGPGDNFEFLGIKIQRGELGNKFYIPEKSKSRIQDDVIALGKELPKERDKQKFWVQKTSGRVASLVKDYRSAYHMCEDWDDFQQTLKQLQVYLCKQIAIQLSKVEKGGDRELLMRLFGV